MAGFEINAQAVDRLRANDIQYLETLEVHDGTQWWAFTNGPEPFEGRVLMGRSAASFFPFTPENVAVTPNGSWAYSQALIDGDVQVAFATQTDTGGVRLVIWAYGSLVPRIDVNNDLWGSDNPFQEIAGVYWRNGTYYILGKRYDQAWDGYRWKETSTPAWAAYDTVSATWQYDHLADQEWTAAIKFVQQGEINPADDLYCARLYNGSLKAWRAEIDDPATLWMSLIAEGNNAANNIESYGVDGDIAIALSVEAGDGLLLYHKSDGWVWQWKYTTQEKAQIWESGAVPLVGGGVLQTIYGEYKILAVSSHGIKTKCAGATLTSTMQILSVRAIDDEYVRVFYYDSGKIKTLRINVNTGAIDQTAGVGLVGATPDRNFWPIYSDETTEIWISNNHNKAVLYKVNATSGEVLWAWSDWAGVFGEDPPGARIIPASTANSTVHIWAGDKAILNASLPTVAGMDATEITAYLSGLSIVDTGFSGDMGRGDPFPCKVTLLNGDYVIPFMVWRDNGDTFAMDACLGRFSSSMTWQSTVTISDIWIYDWDNGVPYPDDWHCAFIPAEVVNYFGVVDLGTVGNAPLWCDVSPWLMNANGVRSYYQQKDRMFAISLGLTYTELPFSRSTYPDGAHIATYTKGDGAYRFFGVDARGQVGFWMWAPGDAEPIEKTIETGWIANYNTLMVSCTQSGDMVALFWEPIYRRLNIFTTSAATARTSYAVALKVTTSDAVPNEYLGPIDTDDAYISLYAAGQRAWVYMELAGHQSVRGFGSASIYEERSFIPYPFRREGVRMDVNSLEKQTKILIPDTQNRDIREMLRSGVDFRGNRCILRRFLADLDPMDAGSSVVLMDGYIQDWAMNASEGIITFTISHSAIDARNPFPPRLLSLNCGHKFKGERCKYAGEVASCDHTKPTCEAYGNIARFGGFEHVAARQRRILWR